MSVTTSITESILGKHLQAIFARDLDAIMDDYVEDSVLITQNGTFKGLAAIRGFFTGALTIFTPEVIATMKLSQQETHGEYAYVVWTAGATVLLGTDTFVIRDGKIVMQSFAAQFGG